MRPSPGTNAYTAQYINDEADALDDFLVYLFVGVDRRRLRQRHAVGAHSMGD